MSSTLEPAKAPTGLNKPIRFKRINSEDVPFLIGVFIRYLVIYAVGGSVVGRQGGLSFTAGFIFGLVVGAMIFIDRNLIED
jgi:hypothetical protein